MKQELKVVVEKETYELTQCLKAFVSAVQQAMADGWDTSKDLPVLMSAALTSLIPAINNATKIGENLAEDKEAFIKGLTLGVEDIALLFLK
jgi:hypothetical protein